MPTFSSNRGGPSSPVHILLKKHPSLFGVPFLLIVVGASFGLQSFTQTWYDLQKQRVTQVRFLPFPALCESMLRGTHVSKEQELGLDKNRKKFDIREEYFKLSAEDEAEWEPKRIARPKGLPEWGVPPEEPP
ncbi:hypothetical protein OF83DRAFT_1030380, partial [Amylostereum chailletii]